jgi:hypothetical protein
MVTHEAIVALPPARPGHLRVIRVEGEYSSASILSVRLDWGSLPNPYNDSPRHSMMLEEVCAAHPHTFHEWFPEWAHEWFAEHGLRVVALDVPNEHAVVQEMQVCIRREHAVTVAVLH